jgi:hypothetical protein
MTTDRDGSSAAWRRRLRRRLYPTCPICGQTHYLKTMPLHLSGHRNDDPDVIAWRNSRAR